MSLNLHDIVRGAINANLEDQTFTLYRSEGQSLVRGIMTASYRKLEGLTGNFQSEGDAALYHAEMAAQNTITRKVYVYAPDDTATRIWSLYRPLSRSGDFIQDRKGDYWKVEAVIEDFSDAGWECLRVQFQTKAPVLNVIEDEQEKTDE